MESLLIEFELQFATLTAEITSKICSLSNKTGDSTKLCSEISKGVEDAKELLEHMDLEIKESDLVHRERLKTRFKSYQVELYRLEGEFVRTKKQSFPNEASLRAELFDGGSPVCMSLADEQKQKLLDNMDKVEQTSKRLNQGYRIALETEAVGAEILGNLSSQRQTIEQARERLRETDDTLDYSSRTLNSMLRRALQNRFILYVAIGGVSVAFLIVLYVFAT